MTKESIPPSPDTETLDKTLPDAIVGIGASAGGLEALQSFFEKVPIDSGMAYVVIQHLSPDHKSLMVELLSRKTIIPVQRAEDGLKVERNHIYLIPPKKNLTLFHGEILLNEPAPRGMVNLPVDLFFRSLAEDQGEKAVGIILSGTGSDGTRGVRAVKEHGGLVMVQDEASAKFDGMPKAAASTGVADFRLPPDEMPDQLLACLRHPYVSRTDRNQEVISEETGLTRLFSMLRSNTKVDFTFYKQSTILRRIERRIAVTQMADLDAYLEYLSRVPSELDALYRELLIGVTSFFRDTEVMTLLSEEVIPELIKNTQDPEMRFWVAGCSTGEEAYTIAIIVSETMEKLGISKHVKIFATDIDKDAILKAGMGVYPESIAADLNAKLLTKYFYFNGESYQVTRSIREMVVFAQHNLVKDPPFTRIDFVSCRNLLIYLQHNLQQQALNMFAFSLKNGGVLTLGTSETVGDMEDRFLPIDRKLRVYRSKSRGRKRLEAVNLDPNETTFLRDAVSRQTHGHLSPPLRHQHREHERMLYRLLESISNKLVSLAVVVNEQMEVVHTLGTSEGIFRLPSGRAVLDVTRMVDREIAIPLATGIQKAFRTHEELLYSNVRIRSGQDQRNYNMRFRPLEGRKTDEPLVIVFFEEFQSNREQNVNTPAVEYDLGKEANQRLQDLEQELQFSRENLQATIEELETSNEELQATNEELLASNEELQSTNQELQSTNEELYTVNAEFQSKIIELTELQNDVDNLLSSSRISTLLLDENLCIRRFSKSTMDLFHLTMSDAGRPLQYIAHNLLEVDPTELAKTVQDSHEIIEKNVEDKNGRSFLMRVLPYSISPTVFSGVVISLVDISTLQEVKDQLERSITDADDILKNAPLGIWVFRINDAGEMVLIKTNPSANRLTGAALNPSSGDEIAIEKLFPKGQICELKDACLHAYRNQRQTTELFFDLSVAGGSQKAFRFHGFPLRGQRFVVCFEEARDSR